MFFRFKTESIEILISILPQILIHVVEWLTLWHSSRETEVTDLGSALTVNKNIGRLDVSVHDVGRVQKVHRAQQVVH